VLLAYFGFGTGTERRWLSKVSRVLHNENTGIKSKTWILGNRNAVRNVGQIDIESTSHLKTCINLSASKLQKCVFQSTVDQLGIPVL
jgi:hypothetical protein